PALLDLPSFPTRRSSDLRDQAQPAAEGAEDRGGIARGDRETDFALGGDPADLAVALHAEIDRATPFVALIVVVAAGVEAEVAAEDRKSTRLNSSHVAISY